MDFNADIHGNWTLENAKSRLHQFLQTNKIQTDYSYKMVGPDHNRFVEGTCNKVFHLELLLCPVFAKILILYFSRWTASLAELIECPLRVREVPGLIPSDRIIPKT